MAKGGLERSAVRSHQRELKDYSFLIIIPLAQRCHSLFVNSLAASLYGGSWKTKAALPCVFFCQRLSRSPAQGDSVKGALSIKELWIPTWNITIIRCFPLISIKLVNLLLARRLNLIALVLKLMRLNSSVHSHTLWLVYVGYNYIIWHEEISFSSLGLPWARLSNYVRWHLCFLR